MEALFFLTPFYALLTALSFQRAAEGCTGQKLPVGRTEGNVIQRMVGNDMQLSEFVSSSQGPAFSCDELRCSFDQTCCWRNENGEATWMKASGSPETEKIQNSFGTGDLPNGDFLVASSEGARSSSDKAVLVSCRVSCTASDITLRARHWQSRGVSLQACLIDGDTQKKTCKSWPASNGAPDTVTLPGGGKNAQIVIEAIGFTTPAGSVAMLDDLAVDCQTCSSGNLASVTSPAIIQSSAVSVSGACTKIVCNFEQNNPCSYSDARSAGVDAGNANVEWKVVPAPFQNKLTGISKAAEGSRFAAAYLKPGDKAALITEVNYPADYVVRLNGYRATEGINLFGCCNDVVVCPFSTTEQVQVSDYRVWKTASITCPTGTKKIIFYAVNSGRNQGAVGLDNVQLLVPSSTPDKATQSAC